jgi:hypothetical protein
MIHRDELNSRLPASAREQPSCATCKHCVIRRPEEEICYVAVLMLKILKETEPNFFRDFMPNDKGFWRPQYPKV